MLPISRTLGIAIGLSACLSLFAKQQEPDPSPEERVDAVFARFDSTRGPGCSVSVSVHGEIVLEQGYGMANLDHDIPIRPDTVFHVASVSKEFTAASIALLALEGKLSLDDPIQKHLPWVPQFEYPITLRNLVHHNSGMRDQWSLLGMSGWRYSEDLITNDDVKYLIGMQRDLNFPPGDRYLYSNTGYTLLGMVVEAVSGQSLREFTTERIFEPLGMTRTHFRDDFSEIVKGQAYGYRRNNETGTYQLSVTNFDTVGATSLLTTAQDMARWDRNFIDPVVGGQAFLDLIHQRGKLNSGENQSYAFGLTVGTYRGQPTVGHGGSDAGYRSNFVRFPEQSTSVVVLCNLAQTNSGRLALDVADIYLEEQLDPVDEEDAAEAEAVPVPEAEAARIKGVYWHDELGAPIQVESHDGDVLARIGQQAVELIYTGNGVFRMPETSAMVRFEPATGAVERMMLWSPDDEQERQSASRLEPADAGTASPGDYVGSYTSPELPVTYHIVLDQDHLAIRWLKHEPDELALVANDLLVGGDVGSLRFRRDESGQVTGFTLDAGRVRNFRFEKQR